MTYLFIGMLLGMIVGLAIGSLAAIVKYTDYEIKRLKKELGHYTPVESMTESESECRLEVE